MRAPDADLRHEWHGAADAPVVVVLGGISATRHVARSVDDPSPGWWDGVVAPGAGIDTTRWHVLGIDHLDGGRGADGRPLCAVTTADQADELAHLLDRLDVPHVHAIVGASYGGMVALAFGARHAARVGRLIVIGAAHESHPMSTALRVLQRRVVTLGLDTGRARDALAIARGIAMTTYRTADEFATRFTHASHADGLAAAVGDYLAHCGTRWADHCPPERFLALSQSLDTHRVVPESIHVPATLVAIEGDQLVPESQLRELAARFGAPCTLTTLATRCGHDGFLTEPAAIGRLIADALTATPALRGHVDTPHPSTAFAQVVP